MSNILNNQNEFYSNICQVVFENEKLKAENKTLQKQLFKYRIQAYNRLSTSKSSSSDSENDSDENSDGEPDEDCNTHICKIPKKKVLKHRTTNIHKTGVHHNKTNQTRLSASVTKETVNKNVKPTSVPNKTLH